MGAPKSVVKFSGNGVKYTSEVDKANYYITELARAALRDAGKYICKITRPTIPKKTGKLRKQLQYWVKAVKGKELPTLIVGYKKEGFYGRYLELGTKVRKGRGKVEAGHYLEKAVTDNVATIRKIEAQYLSAISDESKAKSLINEGEYQGE